MTKLLAVLVVLSTPSVWGEGLKYVPKWRMVGELACYDLNGAKALTAIDADMAACLDKERLFKLELAALQAENTQVRLALDSAVREAALWKTTATEQQAAYNRCITEKNDCRIKEATPSPAWFVAGALLILGAGLTVGYVIFN